MIFDKILKLPYILRWIWSHPLNKEKKIFSIIKFFNWQIISLILKKKKFRWVENTSFEISKSDTGMTGNLYGGFLEFEDMVFLMHALKKDYLFIDVGANIGAYTLIASSIVGAKTIAYEAYKPTFKKLFNQIKLNNLENLVALKNRGVGNKNKILSFTTNKQDMNSVAILGKDFEVVDVEFCKLDDDLTFDNENIIVKIDVEGYEMNVIEGAQKMFSSPNVIAVIVEHNGLGKEFGFTDQNVYNKMLDFGFSAYSYLPFQRSFISLNNYKTKNKYSDNVIYIKDFNKIIYNCKNAKYRNISICWNKKI